MASILKGDTNYDFVGRNWLWGLISGGLTLASILLVVVRGINFGIDFQGGYEIQARFPVAVDDRQIQNVLEPLGLDDVRVQSYGDAAQNEFLIMVQKQGTMTEAIKAAVRADLETLAGSSEQIVEWTLAESGETLTVGFATPVSAEQLKGALEKHGLTVRDLTGGERSDQPTYKVALVSVADQIERALTKGFNLGADQSPVKSVEFVGPQVGAQLRNQGIYAVLWSLFFILLYIGFRFDLYFAPGAIVSLLHDVTLTVGVFSLFQLEFNLPVVAAILTIIGYSLNDTIVVYDRVRENAVRLRGRELRPLVNTSINQTLSRTLLTGGSVLGVTVILWWYGMGDLRVFAIALFTGIVVGTYSTVAVAAPVYVVLRERYGKRAGESQGQQGSGSAATTTAT